MLIVGMTRFELATTRPPDVYSNRTELHPDPYSRVTRAGSKFIKKKFKKNNNYFFLNSKSEIMFISYCCLSSQLNEPYH